MALTSLTPAEHLRLEAARAEERAIEDSRIADALDAESAKRREASSDWRHHADELRAAANRLDAATESALVAVAVQA